MLSGKTSADKIQHQQDVIDTTALGYTYPKIPPTLKLPAPKPPAPTLRITGANRAQIAGSFYISTWMDEAMLDIHPVLSRWHVSGCANCQTHLNVKTFVSLPQGVTDEKAAGAKFSARVHTRDDPKGEKATSVLPAPRLVGLKGQESSGGGGGTGVLTAVKKVFVGEL
jgi:tyrosinase